MTVQRFFAVILIHSETVSNFSPPEAELAECLSDRQNEAEMLLKARPYEVLQFLPATLRMLVLG